MNEQTPQNIEASEAKPVKKKGRASWKRAGLNEFYDKDPNFVYRMIRKDPDNVATKLTEGWELCSDLTGKNTKYKEPGRINDGKPLTSVREGKDWILGKLPRELPEGGQDYLARTEMINKENARRISGLTAHFKKEAAKEGADTHGSITISSRTGTQVIE